MISTLAYRQELQREQTAGLTRFSGLRGRVLTGFGGDLAGYNQSLIQNRASLEDELVQKKYDRGEISFDELLAHLTKASERPWISPEERRLMQSNVKDLRVKYQDEQVAKEYQSGRIKANDVANYQRSKLSEMLPGTPVYENQLSEVAKWEKEGKTDVAKQFVAKENARIAAIADPKESYTEQSSAYRQAANMFRMAGDEMSAYQYEQAANEADVNKLQFEEKESAQVAENNKTDLVNRINLAYNDYHDGNIDGQTFLSQLDGFQREAITGQYTDLLDNMNKLVDYTREDVAYGKDWMRGGTRIKGPGVGTSSGGVDPLTGEVWGDGTSGSGTAVYSGTGVTTSGVSSARATGGQDGKKQTWEEEDQTFRDNFNKVNNEIISGDISKQEYIQSVQDIISARKADLEQRIVDIENSGVSKVRYKGSNQNVRTVVSEIQDELQNNWGKQLGMTKSEVGEAGLADMEQSLVGDVSQIANTLDLVVSQPKNVIGADYQAMLTPKSPLSTGYVTDDLGRQFKIKSQKFEDILSLNDYSNLISTNPERALDYTTKDGQTYVKKDAKLYVDVPSSEGESARYYLNQEGKVTGFEPTLRDVDKYKQYLPEGKTISDYLPKPTTESPLASIRPLQQIINEATTSAKTEKDRLIAESQPKIFEPVKPISQVAQEMNQYGLGPKQQIASPVKAPEVQNPFARSSVTNLPIITPSKQPAPSSQVRGPQSTPAISSPIRVSTQPQKVEAPKQNLLQKATSWITGLFSKKK